MKIKVYFFVVGAALLIASCSGKRHITGSKGLESLKVMSYNVHHCNPPAKPGVIDLDGIAAVINAAKPDIVGLQEIDVKTGRSGKNIDQAEELAKKTGMYFFFGKAIDHDGGDYGVALLSKYPISETQIHRLSSVPGVKGEPRILITAKISLPSGKNIRFANTHLDAGKDQVIRLAQMSDINAIAERESLPMVITGDFNARPDSEVIKLLDKIFLRTCTDCAPTIPADKPVSSIDFIAFKNADKLLVRNHEVVSAPDASDHLPVVAILDLK